MNTTNKPHLNKSQLERKQLILQCLAKELTTMEAALKMCLTRRAVQKNIARYKAKGDAAFIHGNTGKKRGTKANEERRKRIADIIANDKDDLGRRVFENITYSFAAQMLTEDYGVKCSASWAKKIMRSLGYTTSRKHRVKKEKQHVYREREEHTGELVQADGTVFDWFGDGKKYCIHGFIDDATSTLCGLYMTKNECLLGYVEAFRQMAEDYGIPEQLYPDRAGVFFVNNQKKGEPNKTQFGKMMDTLGVDMFPAYSPQAKGRMERCWGTAQEQLPILFRMYNIRTVEEANEFLRDVYRHRFTKHYGVKAKSKETKFVEASEEQINSILIARYEARTDKGGAFTFKGYRLFCPDLPKQKIHIYMSEREGIYASPITKKERHEIKVLETDTSGDMPQVLQDLFEKTLLKNAKPRYKEVYMEIDYEAMQRFSKKEKSA